jgi:ferredoxin
LAALWSRLLRLVSPQDQGGTVADGYHGKVLPLAAARSLVTVDEDIVVRDLERVLPYPRARAIVLRNPDHILALECPCRSSRRDPCLPLDVCLIVGEPFAGLVAEHHPRRSRWLSAAEAVQILEAEHARGHVHHAFFKDAMLGRFYAICNCCSCCCGAMRAHRNGTPMLASSGFLCRLNERLCTGCGECGEICPFDALSFESGEPRVNEALCMGCGVCTSVCDTQALTLVRDPARGEPLEVVELLRSSARR